MDIKKLLNVKVITGTVVSLLIATVTVAGTLQDWWSIPEQIEAVETQTFETSNQVDKLAQTVDAYITAQKDYHEQQERINDIRFENQMRQTELLIRLVEKE